MSESASPIRMEIDPPSLAHPTLAFLQAYWNRKRGTRAMPARADISPSDLREHLRWIVMVDVLPGFNDFRYRLIGTLVSEYFYLDATHMTIREAYATWPTALIDGVVAVHRRCARSKVAVHMAGEADWMGMGYERFESLYLPLSDDGENCNVVLNAFVFDREKVLLARQVARANGLCPKYIPLRSARHQP